MKKILLYLLLLAAALHNFSGRAQQKAKDPIVGTWKGTSLCQVKPSGCHDENAVYHVSKSSKEKTYTFQMNKIVGGVEEEMGSTDFVYDEQKKTLTGITKDRQGRPGIWLFRLDGNKIHGSLTVNDNTVFRLIEVEKN